MLLSRRPAPAEGPIRTLEWDGRTVGPWAAELEGARAVVNLAGRSVACLYTAENRREIVASRVDSARAVESAIARCACPPPVWVQASSLAIYGNPGDRECGETAPHGSGFSAEVCEAWEKALFETIRVDGPRKIALRIGFVLGRDGGALEPLAKLARWYLGGAAGTGRQYISWIHVEDFCRIVQWVIDRAEANGIYNVTAPNPVTNAEFMREVRHVLGRPWSPPAPAWAVKLGARFVMKADPSLALTGRRCLPARLQEEGFAFLHADLPATLRELLAGEAPAGGMR